MLTKDLALYQDTIASLQLSALNDRFEMLRQLGNVFIVQPDILKSYLAESYLARIENRLLRPFVMMRTDYGDHTRKFWEDVFGPEGGVEGVGAAPAAGGGAFSKGGVGGASWGGLGAAMSIGGSAQGSPNTNLAGASGVSRKDSGRNASLFGLGSLMKELEGMSGGERSSFASQNGGH